MREDLRKAVVFVNLWDAFGGENNASNRAYHEIEILLLSKFDTTKPILQQHGHIGLKFSTVVEWVKWFLVLGLYESSLNVLQCFPALGQYILSKCPDLPGRKDSYLGSRLPYPVQHVLLSKMQSEFEHACYSFVKKQFPDVLAKQQRWTCPESFELIGWRKLFPKTFTKQFPGFDVLMQKLVGLRHTAVHRVHLPISVIVNHNKDALQLMEYLQDSTRHRMFLMLGQVLDSWESEYREEMMDTINKHPPNPAIVSIEGQLLPGLPEFRIMSLDEERTAGLEDNKLLLDRLEAIPVLVGQRLLNQITEILEHEEVQENAKSNTRDWSFNHGDINITARRVSNARENRKNPTTAASSRKRQEQAELDRIISKMEEEDAQREMLQDEFTKAKLAAKLEADSAAEAAAEALEEAESAKHIPVEEAESAKSIPVEAKEMARVIWEMQKAVYYC